MVEMQLNSEARRARIGSNPASTPRSYCNYADDMA